MTDLEQSAYNYGEQVAKLKSGRECGVPPKLEEALVANIHAALENLIAAAEDYYRNVYDGATE